MDSSTSVRRMKTAHSIANANEVTQPMDMSTERHLQEYQTSTPWLINPGAPILGSTSSLFVFSPFDPSPIIPYYRGEAYDNDTEPSLSTGTSANSSVVMTTPFHPSSDREFRRIMYHALTPPRSHLHAGNGASKPIGLGFLDLFKEDGTPFEGAATITQEADEELYSFLDGFYTDDSLGNYNEESLSATLVDGSPSPRLLDEVFSSLAPAKVSVSSKSRSRESNSNVDGRKCGPEEPEYDDVFIERGRTSRGNVQAAVAQTKN
jgi:hypothetical protein